MNSAIKPNTQPISRRTSGNPTAYAIAGANRRRGADAHHHDSALMIRSTRAGAGPVAPLIP
ncbi:protein of unknown function [Streptomyces sp. KY75]|nr:protein of unknown function [Streptomyces sp. KY70]CAD5995631.1 protein of unknown function [Streptomyces sp. KY75]